MAAHAGAGKDRGVLLRRDAGDHDPPRARGDGAGQRADHEKEHVLGVKGPDARFELIPRDARGDAQPADVGREVGSRVHCSDGAGREVRAQELAGPAVEFVHSFSPVVCCDVAGREGVRSRGRKHIVYHRLAGVPSVRAPHVDSLWPVWYAEYVGLQ